jgi:hypothetical protein
MTESLSVQTLITRTTFNAFGKCKKICSMILFPFLPAVVLYQEFKLKIHLLQIFIKVKREKYNKSSDFITCKNNIKTLSSFRTKLRATENVAEHFPQLVILILILMLRKTLTPTVAQMDKIFLNNKEIFIFLSTSWSFVSLLKGLLSFIK